MKALFMNRVADFFLSIGIVIVYYVFKTLTFSPIMALVSFFENKNIFFLFDNFYCIDLICLLLFIGAMGKSAQFGLHTWLPDAMEGPTPVSALIHAATMVTAGVFLLIKCSPVFEYSTSSLLLVTFIGLLTAIFAASSGLVQNDIKKVIAYSTCSQLGYMIFSCGLSQFDASLFHLSNHAVFKALLFLSAGSIIHGSKNEQDMRKFGSRGFVLPFTVQSLFIGSLALVGFPFLTGYYSKDLIIELSFSQYTISSSVCCIVAMMTTFLTSMYSYRVLYLTAVFKTNSYKNSIDSSHEAPIFMSFPLFVLSVGSFFSGYIFKDLFVGLGTQF